MALIALQAAEAPTVWTIIEAISGASVAAFAAWQIFLSRRESANRAAFEHLRELDRRVQDIVPFQVEIAQEELLQYYRNPASGLTQGARAYLALLNSLEVLCYAIRQGLVSRKVVDGFIRTIATPRVVGLTFLKKLQACCDDVDVYEHIFWYLPSLRHRKRPLFFLSWNLHNTANGKETEHKQEDDG